MEDYQESTFSFFPMEKCKFSPLKQETRLPACKVVFGVRGRATGGRGCHVHACNTSHKYNQAGWWVQLLQLPAGKLGVGGQGVEEEGGTGDTWEVTRQMELHTCQATLTAVEHWVHPGCSLTPCSAKIEV